MKSTAININGFAYTWPFSSTYGTWVEEILKPIIEKEEAKKNEEFAKYWAKIEDDMKTKEGEKNTISEKESGMVSTLVVENEKWNWFDFIYY